MSLPNSPSFNGCFKTLVLTCFSYFFECQSVDILVSGCLTQFQLAGALVKEINCLGWGLNYKPTGITLGRRKTIGGFGTSAILAKCSFGFARLHQNEIIMPQPCGYKLPVHSDEASTSQWLRYVLKAFPQDELSPLVGLEITFSGVILGWNGSLVTALQG